MSKKYTHTGNIYGCDSRTPEGFSETVLLRETKTLWIAHGQKYRKGDGSSIGSAWPMYKLDLETIKEI